MSLIVITANTEEEAYPYQKIIAEFGSNCLVMTTEKNVLMDTILNDMTGLLLSGGHDIHPKFYGQEIDPKSNLISNEARDLMEFSFLQKALEGNLPVLAICRGMQLLNVAFGGSLIQHIEGHSLEQSVPPDVEKPKHHPVYVSPGSKLAAIIGLGAVYRTNSEHHQGLKEAQRAKGLLASAYHTQDGIIEALESPSHDWVIGLQCHPEKTTEVPSIFFRLFQGFVERSENNRV